MFTTALSAAVVCFRLRHAERIVRVTSCLRRQVKIAAHGSIDSTGREPGGVASACWRKNYRTPWKHNAHGPRVVVHVSPPVVLCDRRGLCFSLCSIFVPARPRCQNGMLTPNPVCQRREYRRQTFTRYLHVHPHVTSVHQRAPTPKILFLRACSRIDYARGLKSPLRSVLHLQAVVTRSCRPNVVLTLRH